MIPATMMPCAICRDRHENGSTQRLQRLLGLMRGSGIEPDLRGCNRFMWGAGRRCRYGLICPDLHQADNSRRTMEQELEPYLYAVAISGDDAVFHETLTLLTGHFPAVWQAMNRLRATSRP